MVGAGTARYAVMFAPTPPAPGSVEEPITYGVTDFAGHRTQEISRLHSAVDAHLEDVRRSGPLNRLLMPLIQRITRRMASAERLYLDGELHTRNRKTGVWHDWSFPPEQRCGYRQATDPMWQVYTLAGARDPGAELERRDVRGVSTRGVAVDLDFTQVIGSLPYGMQDDLAKDVGKRARLEHVPARVWLDDEGLVRRMSIPNTPDKREQEILWYTLEFWHFGVPFIDPRHDPPDRRASGIVQGHEDDG
jgi:hypothetical protein